MTGQVVKRFRLDIDAEYISCSFQELTEKARGVSGAHSKIFWKMNCIRTWTHKGVIKNGLTDYDGQSNGARLPHTHLIVAKPH